MELVIRGNTSDAAITELPLVLRHFYILLFQSFMSASAQLCVPGQGDQGRVFENEFSKIDRLTHYLMKALSQNVIKSNNDNVIVPYTTLPVFSHSLQILFILFTKLY